MPTSVYSSQAERDHRYWISFGSQTIGGLILLWRAVPSYRAFLANEASSESLAFLWAFSVLGFIQPAYWMSRRMTPTLPQRGSWRMVVGHIVLFFSRLALVFVGGVFSAMFYARYTPLDTDPIRIFIIFFLLFSLFCYTLELEKLGRALISSQLD